MKRHSKAEGVRAEQRRQQARRTRPGKVADPRVKRQEDIAGREKDQGSAEARGEES